MVLIFIIVIILIVWFAKQVDVGYLYGIIDGFVNVCLLIKFSIYFI